MLTKHNTPEDTFKCVVELEEEGKVTEYVESLLEKNAQAISSSQVNLVKEGKVRLQLDRTETNAKNGGLGKVTEKLYNLEPNSLPERPLNIDLDLYQMEN